MAKLIPLPDGSVWEALGGKTRRYRLVSVAGEPVEGGATISRRQFDKLSGRLGEFASYEEKAKASPPEVRALRPARGRRVSGILPEWDFRRLAPFRGRITRDVTLDLLLPYVGADTFHDLLERAEDLREPYDSIKQSLIRNGKVSRVQLIVSFVYFDADRLEQMYEILREAARGEDIVNLINDLEEEQKLKFFTIQAPTFPDEILTFEEFIGELTVVPEDRRGSMAMWVDDEGAILYVTLTYRVAFKRQYIKERVRVPKGTLKRDLAGARKRSARRSARRR